MRLHTARNSLHTDSALSVVKSILWCFRYLQKIRCRKLVFVALLNLLPFMFAGAQVVPYARTFPKSKEEVDQALQDLKAYAGQKLPIVDGFVGTPEQPLNRYERAFYQFSIELLSGASGGTIVQVSAKITAWYADKDPAKSGYQILPSNGRLELDLLDRVDEKCGNRPEPGSPRALATSTISAPTPKLNLGDGFGTTSGLTAKANPIAPAEGSEELNRLRGDREAAEKGMRSLNAEVQGLEDAKKNQAHPLNLISVKRAGAPVFARANDAERVLFKAAANDEFEFLDADAEWVHVQISGVSRGYIRRNAVELPEAISARIPESAKTSAAVKTPAFRIVREEESAFPGSWEPLRGKIVKIYTVQPITQDPKETNAQAKLNFTASLFQKFAAEFAQRSANQENAAQATTAEKSPPKELAKTGHAATENSPAMNVDSGIAVIFDSADGGIVGATLETVQQFVGSSLPAASFWQQCYLDPPEVFQAKH